MNKSVLGLVISLLFTVVATTHSFAVEFGQDATGDPNAVHGILAISLPPKELLQDPSYQSYFFGD